MKINEVAKLTGITIRTLHYYDEIGLLHPDSITEAGYRIYNDDALATLQQILFFRELDFPLSVIKDIMTSPHYDKVEALTKQKELLLLKRNRLDGLITLIDNNINGERAMSFKEFDTADIKANKIKYAAEVKERWGRTEAYKESESKTAAYDEEQWKILKGEGVRILQCFGEIRQSSPDSDEAQQLVAQWQEYISANFYTCSNEILSCLGLMYIGDERFTKNIDQHGAGTAEFMAKAIEIYCAKHMYHAQGDF